MLNDPVVAARGDSSCVDPPTATLTAERGPHRRVSGRQGVGLPTNLTPRAVWVIRRGKVRWYPNDRYYGHRNEIMSLRDEELTPEELALQASLDRSWAYAQKALAEPEFRTYLEQSIDRVNQSSATPISTSEFLAQTEPLID